MSTDPLSIDDLLAPQPKTSPVPDGYNSPGHMLVVAEEWDEDTHGLSVEHPETCPTDRTDDGRMVYGCAVAENIEAVGIDSDFQHRDDEYQNRWSHPERLAPGRYPIETWFETHPGGPWGPTEYSSGLRLVQPPTEETP